MARDEQFDVDDDVLLELTIRLTRHLIKTRYQSELKGIVYYTPELKITFTSLTNDFTINAKDIAIL